MVNKSLFIRFFLVFCLFLSASWTSIAVAAEPAGQVEMTVNINTASAEQLADALNGVGLKRAEAIVSYRDANGKFDSIDQLLNVKGVGETVLEKNRARITL